MRRFYLKTKPTVEDCKTIDVKFLKRHGYLKPSKCVSGGIIWNRNGTESGSVAFSVNTSENFIHFSYKRRQDNSNEDWQIKDYKIALTTTPCNFGGFRCWFVCYGCDKRVGSLHLYGSRDFRCRSCLGLSYRIKNESKIYRNFKKLIQHDEIEDKIHALARKHYKGRPTRRYIQLIKHKERLYSSFKGHSRNIFDYL